MERAVSNKTLCVLGFILIFGVALVSLRRGMEIEAVSEKNKHDSMKTVLDSVKTLETVIRAEERQKFIDMLEARRLKIMSNPDDPSWTEHFAELQNEVRAMK